MTKPFSQACENNKEPIYNVLKHYIQQRGSLLEVGSGTGQHTVYLAEKFPDIKWHPTDLAENLPGINLWIEQYTRQNIQAPVEFDVKTPHLFHRQFNYVYSSNTLHIMSMQEVEMFFDFVENHLSKQGHFFVYGPFNYNGKFTSDSNQRFNDWLVQQAPHRAIRDFEWVNELAKLSGLKLVNDHEMPANNRLLVWVKL